MRKVISGFIVGIIVTLSISAVASKLEAIQVSRNNINLEVNGEDVETDNFVYEGRTYVQLRAIAEMLGKNVGWDGTTDTASINDVVPEQVTVIEHIGTGEFYVEDKDGEKKSVKLIGIKTSHNADEDSGKLDITKNYVIRHLPIGVTVYLTADKLDTDENGSLLRYVWLSKPSEEPTDDEVKSRLINSIIIATGNAEYVNNEPNVKYKDLFEEMQEEAKDNNFGIWLE